MELAALSLSCNVLQLIRDAITTGQVIHKVYKTGKLEGLDNIEKRLGDFDKLLECSKDLSAQPSSLVQIDAAKQTAAEILQKCSHDAKLLRSELQKLQTSQQGTRRFAFAFKAVFSGQADRVEAARLRLEESRAWLNSSLLPVVVYVL
jgi:hypothetical protein